jgi:4-hydroxy 2-oxovalerate aldolase
MNVQISDCTIRDGGYLTSKNSAPEFIHGVIDGLKRLLPKLLKN